MNSEGMTKREKKSMPSFCFLTSSSSFMQSHKITSFHFFCSHNQQHIKYMIKKQACTDLLCGWAWRRPARGWLTAVRSSWRTKAAGWRAADCGRPLRSRAEQSSHSVRDSTTTWSPRSARVELCENSSLVSIQYSIECMHSVHPGMFDCL